jgi:hypothetical protein
MTSYLCCASVVDAECGPFSGVVRPPTRGEASHAQGPLNSGCQGDVYERSAPEHMPGDGPT